MKDRVEVHTNFSQFGEIVQETRFIENNQVARKTRQILDLREEGIKNALIKLGWTPPKGKNDG